MAKETELKLRASAQTLAKLRAHPLLVKRNKSGWQSVELFNQYYDTPEQLLNQAQVALRVRRDGEHFIQTLKSRGASVAGLSVRNEWEWPLSSEALDIRLLDEQCWPERLRGLDKAQLKPAFRTDFNREKAEIAWGRGKAKVVIEAALDQGWVEAGTQREAISELELELRQGEPVELLELALQLACELPLMPCDVSKAERGYRQLNAKAAAAQPAASQLVAEQPLDETIGVLLSYLLACSQHWAEQYLLTGHWKALQQWLAQLVDLRALLGCLGQVVPRACSRELREDLDGLISDWQPFIATGKQDESLRQSAPQRFAEELEQLRWGRWSLRMALWLNQRHWQAKRTPSGQRQGACALGIWLHTWLASEVQSAHLLHYFEQPQKLIEQLPRLVRMQAWLRLARQVLTLDEVDRFYGELAKLAQLAEPQANDALAERSQQAHTVATLKAWKQLLG